MIRRRSIGSAYERLAHTVATHENKRFVFWQAEHGLFLVLAIEVGRLKTEQSVFAVNLCQMHLASIWHLSGRANPLIYLGFLAAIWHYLALSGRA